VAEIGINHGGDVNKAVQMVRAAAAAGADAVKTQLHIPDEEMDRALMPSNVWETIVQCALSESEERTIQRVAREMGIAYFSTPFCRQAVDILDGMDVPVIKVGSGEISNHVLLRHIAKTGRPVYLSTGMHQMEAVTRALEILPRATLLHCVSKYPCPVEQIGLDRMHALSALAPAGYSSHTPIVMDGVVAAAMGAQVIEKHFDFDGGVDSKVSLRRIEFSEMVRMIREVMWMRRGEPEPERHGIAEWARHGLYAAKNLDIGQALNDDVAMARRPLGIGLPADFPLKGLVCTRQIAAGAPISIEDVQ
jgi:sialic acid synthase SpsE